jgi:hypothetical protein
VEGGERGSTLIYAFRDIISGWRTVTALAARVKEPEYAEYLTRYILSKSVGTAYDPDSAIQSELIGLGALALIEHKGPSIASFS